MNTDKDKDKYRVGITLEPEVMHALDDMVDRLGKAWGYGANVTRASVVRMAVVRGLAVMQRTMLDGNKTEHDQQASERRTDEQL